MEKGEVKAVLPKLDLLEDDHTRADTIHADVDRLGRIWLERGSLSGAESARFSELVAELVELYSAHIVVEEHELFPVAATVLEQPDSKAIGSEMAARRGLRNP
jgi:hypothetical protein